MIFLHYPDNYINTITCISILYLLWHISSTLKQQEKINGEIYEKVFINIYYV